MSENHHSSDEHNEHGHSLWPYFFVLLTLFGLTVLTWFTAKMGIPHPWDDVAAVGIALTKAAFVIIFFMHVKDGTPLIKIAAAGGFIWMAIFFAIILTDYLARNPFAGWGY